MATYPKLDSKKFAPYESAVRSAKKDLDAQKAAKAPKPKLVAAEKQWTSTSELAGKYLAEQMTIAAKGFEVMSSFVDTQLATAMKATSQARADLKSATPGAKGDAVLRKYETFGDDVAALAEAAKNEMNTFAESWNDYRQTNYDTFIDKKLTAQFGKTRLTIIDRTAKSRATTNKIVALVPEAVALQQALFAKLQGFRADADNSVKLASDLLKSIRDAHQDIAKKAGPDLIQRAQVQFQSWLDNPNFAEFSGQAPIRMKSWDGLKAVGQTASTTRSTTKRAVDTGRAQFTPADLKDPRLAKIVADIDKEYAAFDASVTTNLKALTKIAEIVNKAAERSRKGA